MKKYLLLVGIILSVTVLSGCSESPSSYNQETKKIEENQKNIIENTPIPDLKTSNERVNLIKRAERFDVEDKIGYMYLLSYGKIMAYYTIKGKVSSLNSYLAPIDKLVNRRGNKCGYYVDSEGTEYTETQDCYVVEAPGIDGAYGENDNGVFFFTDQDVYVEWHGEYLYSDQPLSLQSQPELIQEIK